MKSPIEPALGRVAALDANEVLQKRVGKLREVTQISTCPGNAHADHYMRGMANGLILALATMEDEEPAYIQPSAVALDRTERTTSVVTAAGQIIDMTQGDAAARVRDLVANAFKDGFSAGLPRCAWDDAGDWIVLVAKDYATTGAQPPKPFIGKDRTERPDFGTLGAIDETLNAAGLDRPVTYINADDVHPALDASGLDFERTAASMSMKPGSVNTVLPSAPALCVTLDEVRRYAENQTAGRYSPGGDAAVALGLIKALAGIVDRLRQKPQEDPEGVDIREEVNWCDMETRTRALDFAIRANPGHHKTVTEAAEAFYAFLNGEPARGKYATRADIVILGERIDTLNAEMQRAVSGA